MKKIIIYLGCFILILFLIPAFLTKRTEQVVFQENIIDEEENIENLDYEYNEYGEISLLHQKTGEVEKVGIDEYLCNVVSAEMPADYEYEALKAQTIVARTYTVFKIENKKHEEADICDDSSCCQAWISKEDRLAKWDEEKREENWNKICNSVYETKGKIITYENKPINAFFHSNSGGVTEIPINVWGGTGYPYLQIVETSGEDEYNQYYSEVELTNKELINKLKEKYSGISINFDNDDDIKILEYTESQRVKTIKFGNYNLSGVETRSLFGLKSTNFEIEKGKDNIKFSVKGYGHGVGMSQTGADSMAKKGSNSEEIIKHFYTGVEIKDVNSL